MSAYTYCQRIIIIIMNNCDVYCFILEVKKRTMIIIKKLYYKLI